VLGTSLGKGAAGERNGRKGKRFSWLAPDQTERGEAAGLVQGKRGKFPMSGTLPRSERSTRERGDAT